MATCAASLSGSLKGIGMDEIVFRAVKAVTMDDSFKLPSRNAETAMKIACSFLAWWEDHREEGVLFSEQVTAMLKRCFKPGRSLQLRKEKMWGEYHKVRTSPEFKELWCRFISKSLGEAATPTFFQFVTDKIFDDLIKVEFEVTFGGGNSSNQPLAKEEEMALRYVAGYVCRKVREKLESSSHPQKDDMIFCIFSLCGDESDDESWCNLVERGGLWHVNDEAYTLFYAMEEEIRQILTLGAVSKQSEGSTTKIINRIMLSEDVLFQWCILSPECDDAVSKAVLKKVVELYVTIRGFAFASSCLELYKQSKRKALQRSKGIR